VYASEKARFGQPEINVGVFPAPAAAIFPRLVGLKKAFELTLTGNIISAAEAERIGLVNRVEIDKRTDNLCSKSSVVLQLTRKAILESKNLDLAQVMTRSYDIYERELMKTKDAYIGIEAFLVQKKPVWKNE